MIGNKLREAMNEQIKNELESAYIYLSMCAYFHDQGFDGMAGWMRSQALEEMTHAQKFFDYLVERGGKVVLLPLNIAKTEWASPLEAFQDAYKHEQFITGKINELVTLARQENDYASEAMLQWFVTEQVEEEASVSKVVQDFERVGDKGHGLFMLDRELGKRTFSMPAAENGDT